MARHEKGQSLLLGTSKSVVEVQAMPLPATRLTSVVVWTDFFGCEARLLVESVPAHV